jgi:histidine triad (HIT) family protein
LESCLFCQIIDRQVRGKIVYEDDRVVAFEDVNPQAPVHVLVVPRKHLSSLKEARAEDAALLGHLLLVAAQLAREHKLDASGYRTVINTGADGGQTVFHLHVHVVGGRIFHWPPG